MSNQLPWLNNLDIAGGHEVHPALLVEVPLPIMTIFSVLITVRVFTPLVAAVTCNLVTTLLEEFLDFGTLGHGRRCSGSVGERDGGERGTPNHQTSTYIVCLSTLAFPIFKYLLWARIDPVLSDVKS